ncbi:hypothetical protein [Mycobacterium tilburgii]|uniref:hypothetical protein n=1 Tax=Mycobacterium tilburgii TaxID=44467 RepID=UPI0038995C24
MRGRGSAKVFAYFITVFIAAPLAFVTGLLQAPAIAARFGLGRGVFNRQVARTVHFAVLVWMVFSFLSTPSWCSPPAWSAT